MTEGTPITPAQWLEILEYSTHEQKLALAQSIFLTSAAMTKCLMEDHAGAVRYRQEHACPGDLDSYTKGYKAGHAAAVEKIREGLGEVFGE